MTATPPPPPRTVKRGKGTCIATGAAIPAAYIKSEGRNGRLGQQLIAVVAEGQRGRVYCSPTDPDELAIGNAQPQWKPEGFLAHDPNHLAPLLLGLNQWWELYITRQLIALTTFSDLLSEVSEQASEHARDAGLAFDEMPLRDGGQGAQAYADGIITYLAFAINRCADYWSISSTWRTGEEAVRGTFGRQAIPLTYDFAEANPFSSYSGNWSAMVGWVVRAIGHLPASERGKAQQRDARARVSESPYALLATDPPYYDNISYADLSDLFYVWLRRNLGRVWPSECSTLLTPKAGELIAHRYRAGSRDKAKRTFESGMAEFMNQVAHTQQTGAPTTIYYAYKATETSKDGEVLSTGWDTFLQAVLNAGFQVIATWPMHTEMPHRFLSLGSNALASSIVLVCRPRSSTAKPTSRGQFIAALRHELPEAVRLLQSGNIAPVDLPQSAIGPGIKVFSRYERVVEADGSSMPVSDALAIINDVLGEVLDGTEADLDSDTRFALAWFTAHGYNPGTAGDADTVARAKNTSLGGIVSAGIGETRLGKFQLYERSELDPDWSPAGDDRLTVWEATQYLTATLERSETEAAELLHDLGGIGEQARQLAYLLYQKANDRKWASEATAYNNLITAWPNLRTAAAKAPKQGTIV